jgi:hypothetical protein
MEKLVNDRLGLVVGYLSSASDVVHLCMYHFFVVKLLSPACKTSSALLKIMVFWDLMPFSLVDRYQCFRETYWLCHQSNSITSQKTIILIKMVLHCTSF